VARKLAHLRDVPAISCGFARVQRSHDGHRRSSKRSGDLTMSRSRRRYPMDDSRFDALARTFTRVRSRRTVLSTLLAGTLGLHGIADTTAKKRCPPCKKRRHGRCRGKKPDGTVCPGGRCQGGRCISSVEQSPTCPAGECSRKNPCGPGCVCLDTGGGNRRCLAVGTCSGVGVCERGTCGSGCTCVNPGGAKTGCASVEGCPTGNCTEDSCGSDCICVGVDAASRCTSIIS
jgi:hypothetical protein